MKALEKEAMVRKAWSTEKQIFEKMKDIYTQFMIMEGARKPVAKPILNFYKYFKSIQEVTFSAEGDVRSCGRHGDTILQSGLFWALWLAIYCYKGSVEEIKRIVMFARGKVGEGEFEIVKQRARRYILSKPFSEIVKNDLTGIEDVVDFGPAYRPSQKVDKVPLPEEPQMTPKAPTPKQPSPSPKAESEKKLEPLRPSPASRTLDI